MPRSAVTEQNITRGPGAQAASESFWRGGGAAPLGAAAAVSGAALAQGTSTPGMPTVQAPVRQEWLDKRREEIIEPGVPIIDPHHHLWDRPD